MFLYDYFVNYISLFMFITGLFCFSFLHKHILMSLLSLEYLVLCIFTFLSVFLSMNFSDIYIIMLFLTFSVCEGVLGLSILVTIIRSYGNDHIMSLFIYKW
nr:NADH dehydrogenase subunit 4L [Angerianus maurus]